MRFAGLLIFVVLVSVVEKVRPGLAYTFLERFARVPMNDLENFDDGEDINNEDEYIMENNNVKRQNPGGTCTCTCETKPVESSNRRTYPESASLMRTAVKPEIASASRLAGNIKPYQKSNEPEVKQPRVNEDRNIVKTVPTFDYSTKLEAVHDPKDDNERVGGHKVEGPKMQSSSSKEWGHENRFPWERMTDRMCFRDPCNHDSDCCQRYNLCDKSAKVCVDCWYGSTCTSEADCCLRYQYCQRPKGTPPGNKLVTGKCVNKLA